MDFVTPGIGVLTCVIGGWNAYQSQSVRAAILALKVELVDRIGKVEGDLKALDATIELLREQKHTESGYLRTMLHQSRQETGYVRGALHQTQEEAGYLRGLMIPFEPPPQAPA